MQFLRPHAKDLFFPPVPRVKQLVLGNSNALAETANVQSGGKLAVKTKFNGSFNHLMLVRILSQQLDNKVHMFVELTKLGLNSCIQASTCSVETLWDEC